MVKYVTRPVRADYVDADSELTHVPHLVVCDQEPAPTGVYDKHGREFMRLPTSIGFLPRKDKA